MQRSRVRTPSPALHHISKFTAENAEFAEGKQEKTIFDNRTQMNADNQDFKFNLILALNQKLNVRHLII